MAYLIMNNLEVDGSTITVKVKETTDTFEFEYTLPNKTKHPESYSFWTKDLVHKFIHKFWKQITPDYDERVKKAIKA